MKVRVKLKKLNEKAVLPTKATSKDFCYDVVAISEKQIAPSVWQYGLGFAYEIEDHDLKLGIAYDQDGQEVYSMQPADIAIDFRPRSSVWKTGMILSNCEGTLDELYRGEVMAVFYHVKSTMPRYQIGDKIGQIKLGITLPLEFEFVDEINMNTDRGTGGFGSTGLR